MELRIQGTAEPVAGGPGGSRLPLALEHVGCGVCGRLDPEPVAVGEDFEYRTSPDAFLAVRCGGCGLVYLDPRPAESEFDRIYPDSYHAFGFSAERFGLVYRVRQRLEARRLLSWCRGLGPDARILDVGCGDGFHLRLLRRYGRSGWQLEGVDASARAIAAAHGEGIAFHHGRVQELDLPGRSYDRILLIQTLEHVADPAGVLRELARLLSPAGRVIVVTDNTRTSDFRLFRRRHWGGYHFPRHWSLFDAPSLSALADRTGLEVVRLTTQMSPVNWTYSVRNLLEDAGASPALVRRFSLGSPVALAIFTVVDAAMNLVGRGALLNAKLGLAGKTPVPERPAAAAPQRPARSRPPVVVIGAGIAGLVAARDLAAGGLPVRVFEGGTRIAGQARSFRDEDGFTYDFGAHFITNRLAAAIGAGDACRIVRRYGESVRCGGRTRPYPLGLLTVPRYLASALAGRITGWGGAAPASAADWFRAEYGPALAEEIAIPVAEKWSGRSAEDLAPALGEKFSSILHTLVLHLARRLTHRPIASGYCREQPESVHVWHVYPLGGVEMLCERLARGLQESIRLESRVESILIEDGRVRGVRVNGEEHEASAVVSTAPVHVLPRLVEGTEALERFRSFRFRPMVLVNLRLEGRGLLPDVVLWTPSAELPFFRLTEAPVAMPWLAPDGRTLLTVDFGCEIGDPLWEMEDEAVGELCLDPLEAIIPDIRRRYLGCRVLRTPIGYPLYLREYEEDRQALQRSTGVDGLFSIGRNGRFSHDLMEDVYWRTVRETRRVAEFVRAAAAGEAGAWGQRE